MIVVWRNEILTLRSHVEILVSKLALAGANGPFQSPVNVERLGQGGGESALDLPH